MDEKKIRYEYTPKAHLLDQLATLPDSPGVYLMKDSEGVIIYVGKAKNLKNRVRSYFRGFNSHMPRTQTMVVNIADFDYMLTDTEAEALILEANLIKKHQPRFNILLKDDKMYPYVAVTVRENFPRVFLTRSPMMFPDARIYGPFISAEHVHNAIEYITTTFQLRECSKKIVDRDDRPCLNYHIGRCSGACAGKVSVETYAASVREAEKILSGHKEPHIKALEEQMLRCAEKLDFEHAAIARDRIAALEGLAIRQKAIQNSSKNQDYLSGYVYEDKACGMLFQVREGKLEGREVFTMLNAEASSVEQLLTAFMMQYYTGVENIPPEIYLSHEIENRDDFAEWFGRITGRRVQISVPQKGEKKQTVDLVQRNAIEYLLKFQKRIEREYETRILIEKQLKAMLGFPENLQLRRIEAFDISNTSGVFSVGSMVVFEEGRKKRSDYRRYRIRTVEGPDDYLSMQEVLYRRYSKPDLPLPDLILIDGGKGHVSAAIEVLDALKIPVPVAGMVKDDYHKTEDLVYNKERVGLKEYKQAFRLIYDIQEEVHRFAIEYHKSLRSREMVRSELDDIKGIGEKRKIALLKHFKSVENIRIASIEQLLEAEGMTRPAAEAVYTYFAAK
ncbi:MAG: excinuclease ABC subunit UvrC [Bacillota bacterium]|nr:excinuclease ABC subunit UvrC [Bacillota bacterium]